MLPKFSAGKLIARVHSRLAYNKREIVLLCKESIKVSSYQLHLLFCSFILFFSIIKSQEFPSFCEHVIAKSTGYTSSIEQFISSSSSLGCLNAAKFLDSSRGPDVLILLFNAAG